MPRLQPTLDGNSVCHPSSHVCVSSADFICTLELENQREELIAKCSNSTAVAVQRTLDYFQGVRFLCGITSFIKQDLDHILKCLENPPVSGIFVYHDKSH